MCFVAYSIAALANSFGVIGIWQKGKVFAVVGSQPSSQRYTVKRDCAPGFPDTVDLEHIRKAS